MPILKDGSKEQFCQLVAGGLKRTEAIYKAGYTFANGGQATRKASALMRQLEVKARIAEVEQVLRAKGLEEADVDRGWVLRRLKRNVETATQEVAVTDRYGHETGLYKQELPSANKALELIGKEFGMFADRLIFDNLDETLEGLSGEDLRTFVRQAASEVGLRVVDMTDDEKRFWIRRNAPGLGFGLTESSEDPEGAEPQEDRALSSVPEAAGVPRTGLN